MEQQELADWLRLLTTHGIGPVKVRALLACFGLPEHIFAASEAQLREVVGPTQARDLCTVPDGWAAQCDATLQWLKRSEADGIGRDIVTLADPRYPQRLLATEDPPLLLYVMGPATLLESADPWATGRCIAMVGSRNPSAQGRENAQAFAHSLRMSGACIVSGLALGIDAAAHAGALQDLESSPPLGQPSTMAIVGTGLDRVYPSRNHALAQRIAQTGLLVSEYPLGTPPLAGNFPRRNRIIAGLSEGTLVVEAALASGSLITARLATEQGRDVFAIPGSIHAPQSRGCHALIKQGAKLVETAQDVLDELRWEAFAAAPWHQARLADGPAGDPGSSSAPAPDALQDPLLDALGFEPADVDTLTARTGWSASQLQVRLLELELAGEVARLPGGQFQRTLRT
ncbi:DNA-processing protein DprA [Acidovorax lacteus]|uniref:DNA-processing protein DprA n=1 Tax=Acidovorax lacteus TaxID=1924988 RepID=A0ABP8LC24_9BURK